ncbi:sensor histidine kinase [Streptomyces sioyaensis]|uniref:sensor histidine kinase n=1 Tax=Streptomyces sioyaensis TaxID=67364 RepID=UPI0037D41EB3
MRLDARRAAEARVRWFGLWDSYFVVCYLLTTGLVFTSGVPQGHRVVAIGALTLIVPWYAGLGRPLMRHRTSDRRNTLFAAGLFVLFGVAAAVDLMSAFALFALVPMLMMSLAARAAVVTAVLGNLVPVTMLWLQAGGAAGSLVLFVLLVSLLGIALSVLLGLWIKRVVRQNEEHAALIEELRQNREQVARLSHQAGISAERERLAREIHDTLAQSLISIISLVQAVDAEVDTAPGAAREHLALVGRVAKESLVEARAFVADRTPASLQESSLAQALRRQADGLTAQSGLLVRFAVEGTERPLPMAAGVVLLRAAQEAGANVRKHAEARTVDMVLRFGEGQVALRVADDGKGFATEQGEFAAAEESGGSGPGGGADEGEGGGFGLRGMAARVAETGGVMSVVSERGAGTAVEVRIPLAGTVDDADTGPDTARTDATRTDTDRAGALGKSLAGALGKGRR